MPLYLNPQAEHCLDWFHVTMRITQMTQMVKSLRSRDHPTLATDLTNELECLKWFVWHGNVFRALQVVDDLQIDLDVERASPEQRKLMKAITEFGGYIRANATSIPNWPNPNIDTVGEVGVGLFRSSPAGVVCPLRPAGRNDDLPKTAAARQALAASIGADGQALLRAIDASGQAWLQQVPAVQILRRVWTEQYITDAGELRWREVKELPPPAELICSPYDPEARSSTKRGLEWVGYKVHLTGTCDPDLPRLLTNVVTTPATTPDDNMLAVVHASLATRDRLPAEHLVDKGYTDAHVLVDSQREYGVTIVGPVAEDPSWQAQTHTRFAKADFVIAWEAQTATCPTGKPSLSWLVNPDVTKPATVVVRFSRRDCSPCPVRSRCTRRQLEPRELVLQPRVEHEALRTARRYRHTEAFRAHHAARAGIESTHAHAVRRGGLRQFAALRP